MASPTPDPANPAKHDARAAFEALSRTFRGELAFNAGGSPCTAALVVGALGGTVSLQPQTPWDACQTVIASALGAVVVRLSDRKTMEHAELLTDWYALADPGRKTPSVPPHVAARSIEHADVILTALDEAGLGQDSSTAGVASDEPM